MASPQKENGFAPIANEILEALSCTPLSDYESRIIHALWRKTYGFHKKSDWISGSQMIGMVKIHKAHFSRTKSRLIKRKIVTCIGNQMAFNKNYEEWLGVDGVTNLGIKVTNLGNKKLPKEADTKDNKDTYTKDIAKTSFADKKDMKNYNENDHQEDGIPDISYDTGEHLAKPTPQTRKYPNARSVFNLWGNYPANWKQNKTQLQSAENLFAERGIEQIVKALGFIKENRDNEFCPVINSPYDLDSKWAKLISFKKRK